MRCEVWGVGGGGIERISSAACPASSNVTLSCTCGALLLLSLLLPTRTRALDAPPLSSNPTLQSSL